MKAQAGDVFCTYSRQLGEYVACQITKVKEKNQGLLLLLDWHSKEPLTPEQLPGLRPMVLDYFFWQGRYDHVHVPLDVPGNYRFVGNIPPLIDDDSNSWSGWGITGTMASQLWWNTLPAEQRRAFKAAAGSREEVTVAGIPVKKCLSRLYDTQIPIRRAEELQALPCLMELNCTRWYPDLMDYLREDPFLVDLRLENHGQRTLDFRGTSLRKLIVDLTGVEELWLGERMGSLLLLNREPDRCRIHASGEGEGLSIDFKGAVFPHPELPFLSSVSCTGVEELDLRVLREQYPRLRSLRLWGKPGVLKNFGELKRFPELETFTTVDLFGFTGADIPLPEELPCLTWFWMSSLPEDAAKTAKKLYKKREGLNLWITKARKPEWLAENLTNPFRHWDGMEGVPASAAKRAANLYKKLRGTLAKLAGEPPENAMDLAREAVAAYTKPFNRMVFIETEEREDVYAALCAILDDLPEGALDREALLDTFEEIRDF